MTLQVLAENVHTRVGLLPFVSLNQLPIDKDSILLRTDAREKKLPLVFNNDVVTFLFTYDELISLGQAKREHAEVLHDGFTVHANLQIADELIEREINLMRFLRSDPKTELHNDRWLPARV